MPVGGESAKAPGLREIASLAGVSHQTVSRVLSGHPNVAAATRERVMAVVERENYRPSRVARTLTTKRHDRLGVVVESGSQTGPASTLRAVEDAAFARGYSISSMTASERGASVREAVEHLVDHGVDGLIVIAPRLVTVGTLPELAPGVPRLVVTSGSNAGAVSVDQYSGARAAVEHLVAAGHRGISHLAGPADWSDALERERAWRDVLNERGLAVGAPVVGDWTADAGYAAAGRILADAACTAVFVANDQMALGLLHALAERGVAVPADMSVVGFDDVPESRHYLPPLTTVRQDFAALGEAAVDALLRLVNGAGSAVRPVLIPATVVPRASVAVPRV